ncbi:hypothetical protein ACFJIW_11820 [Tahibacter sp. UC22_41]|uniref:hypothetical protein n=1 Tax=Tahibacter sp. UC22_41 TaxID=3350178 RepID=UPI0036D9D4B1
MRWRCPIDVDLIESDPARAARAVPNSIGSARQAAGNRQRNSDRNFNKPGQADKPQPVLHERKPLR